MGKLLLRRGLHYSGRNWTRAHRRWVDSLAWTQPAERVVVDGLALSRERRLNNPRSTPMAQQPGEELAQRELDQPAVDFEKRWTWTYIFENDTMTLMPVTAGQVVP